MDTLLVSVPASDLTRGSPGAVALSRIGVDVDELSAEPCELQVRLWDCRVARCAAPVA